MTKFLDYIRSGEFLIAPSVHYKQQYILKCFECSEYYEEVEKFFEHSIKHYQDKNIEDDDEWLLEELNKDIADEEDNVNEISAQKEKIVQSIVEDPLIDSDDASESLELFIKEEPSCEYHEQIEIEHDNLESEEDSKKQKSVAYNIKDESMDSNLLTTNKASIKSGSFVREFMKYKPYVTALIDIYRKQPKLWNNNISNIKASERNAILEQISKDLKKQVDVDLTYAQVAAIIAHIRYTYRSKLKRIQSGTQQSVVQTWYFDYLDFLKPFIENPPKVNAVQSVQVIDQSQYLLPSVPLEHLTQFLDIYRRHPFLWNTDLAENCCENKRLEDLVKMVDDIELEMHLKITQESLKGYLESVNKCVSHSKVYHVIKDNLNCEDLPDCYKHMKFLYDHVGPFKCEDCSRRYRTALAFKVHKSEHNGSKAIVCSICNREFKMINTYIAHARRHMEDLKDICKECGKRFLNPYDLQIHMRCHTGVKPFCCELCGKSFRHIQTFASHKRKHEQNYLHKCRICSKGFYTKAKHDDHMRTHTNIREFECKICGKAFKTKKTLGQHVVIHDDVRKHACPLCGKTFKLKVGVNQHMRTHGNHVDKTSSVE